MRGALGRVGRLWPIAAAAAIVFATIATQPQLVICPDNHIGLGGLGIPMPGDLCLPTLARTITGANPIAIVASWIIVGAVIALVLWLAVRFFQRQGDI